DYQVVDSRAGTHRRDFRSDPFLSRRQLDRRPRAVARGRARVGRRGRLAHRRSGAAPGPAVSAHPRIARAMPRRQRGFTLIEVVAALVVFALAFSLLIGVTGEN